ncbi:hypothetical protein BJ508DRAFT_380049 [Ascobolus immersus RN42]|uniref:Uncharacterized protein n=1 Tax=Ascobolus immersus RN42 TaxID=1160509 RepID=A0A3N4HUF0_ASCIM|nr:hypothetical protein BJ508DRAFT_380049 [Ascobolus immersus RN42]
MSAQRLPTVSEPGSKATICHTLNLAASNDWEDYGDGAPAIRKFRVLRSTESENKTMSAETIKERLASLSEPANYHLWKYISDLCEKDDKTYSISWIEFAERSEVNNQNVRMHYHNILVEFVDVSVKVPVVRCRAELLELEYHGGI